RVNGKRYSKTLETGTTLTAARNALRNVLSKADDGEHVPPSRMTLNMWFDQWLAIGAPGRGKRAVSERTKERYTQLL
ncbi:UNVERIFIED_CONTAM: hypothetical protein NY603_42175, partial [Bacteroidetes bacterium 56_B9]